MRATLRPAPEDAGIVFRRTDRAGPAIPATLESVTGTAGCVALGGADGVSTVEHLLSAAASLGVDNLAVDVDGPELPGLDGSALPIVRALHRAGERVLGAPRRRARGPRAGLGGGRGRVGGRPAGTAVLRPRTS